jgi:hypothetical protein
MELFFQACGRAGPLRLNIQEDGQAVEAERLLHQPFALVGCDPRMDLFLSHPQVARRHAYLQLQGGKLFCIDLQNQAEIQTGSDTEQPLRIGPFSLRAADGDSEHRPSLADSSASELWAEEDLPEVALEFVNRLSGPTVWRMSTTLTLVGKAPSCRVRLVGSSVSKYHCSLVRTPLGLWVVDLFGKGGITVNDTPLRTARLEDGDRLQVGNFIIRPRYLETPPLAQQLLKHQASSISLPPFRQTLSQQETASTLEPLTDGLSLLASVPAVPPFVPAAGQPVPANAELVQSLLVPIAQQLGTIQQQMFDQFQQAMLMMFQMFGKLQREQIGVIRDEMDRLHQLSQEVLALQTELAKRPQAAVETLQSPALAPDARTVPNGVAAKPEPAPEKDMHVWLSQRLATLQQERQTRWQKIVSFLSGKPRERTTP